MIELLKLDVQLDALLMIPFLIMFPVKRCPSLRTLVSRMFLAPVER